MKSAGKQDHEVVCLGELLVDLFGVEARDLAAVETFKRYPGGAAGNVAVGVARLGCSSGVVTKVGTDFFGDFLLQTMVEHHVDTSAVSRDPKRRTGLAFVSLNENRVPSFTFYRHPSASMYLKPSDLDRDYLAGCEVLYSSSMSLVNRPFRDACYAATRTVRRLGGLIAFDVNLRQSLWRSKEEARQEITRFLRMVDILKIDMQELEFLTRNGENLESRRRALFRSYPNLKILAITRGHEGSLLASSPETFAEIPAFRLPDDEIVDTTGAGDAFMAALLTRVVRDRKSGSDSFHAVDGLKSYGRYASAAAAHAIRIAGVIPALPSETDISAIIQLSEGSGSR